MLPFYPEINCVVAANGYSQIYDSDFIMKCFGNNFLNDANIFYWNASLLIRHKGH